MDDFNKEEIEYLKQLDLWCIHNTYKRVNDYGFCWYYGYETAAVVEDESNYVDSLMDIYSQTWEELFDKEEYAHAYELLNDHDGWYKPWKPREPLPRNYGKHIKDTDVPF